MQLNFTYTGHETFACRSYWLKKGVDFVQDDNSFNAPDSPSVLGVGKNMVRSINFWLKSFAIIDEKKNLTLLAKELFDDKDGWDPYLEDINTIWLLHYVLVKNGYARIYSDFFNEFKKKQSEFTFDSFERFMKLKKSDIAENSIKSDISVLRSNYLRNSKKNDSVEDSFSVFLQELNLLEEVGKGYYKFNNRQKTSLNDSILLYCILDNYKEHSISFDNLLNDSNGPGNIFCMTENELFLRIDRLAKEADGINFTEDAGIREVQIAREYYTDIENVLKAYYEGR